VCVVPALVGGLTGGVLWAAVGGVFTSFIVSITRLSIVYAGFAIFVAALIWIYFAWLILLLGAQLSFYVQNPSYLRIGMREPRLSNAETEQLSLNIMYLVAHAHLRGGERWSINSLAARLAIPGIALARIADALEAAGLLVTTAEETLLPGPRFWPDQAAGTFRRRARPTACRRRPARRLSPRVRGISMPRGAARAIATWSPGSRLGSAIAGH
jgi:hypothetical protein